MAVDKDVLRHIYLGSSGEVDKYTYPRSVVSRSNVPVRERGEQGKKLYSQLNEIRLGSQALVDEASEVGLESGIGLRVTFASFPEVDFKIESLADARQKIELLSVRENDSCVSASVFVPIDKLGVFEKKILDYVEERKNKNGRPIDNRALIDAIESIRTSAFSELWNDDDALLPPSDEESIWWEIWLPVLSDRQAVISDFVKLSRRHNIQVSESVLEFPERSVLLVKSSTAELMKSVNLISKIAEIRRAKTTAEFFDSLDPDEQNDWVQELTSRIDIEATDDSPFICILDSGVNSSHPLLNSIMDEKDRYSVNPAWGHADENGHGTGMAGLAAWGDLTNLLESVDRVSIFHRLESVKLLRQAGDNVDKHHGVITADGISLPEIEEYDRKRIFVMAVTAKDSRDRGRPSAWSSTVDGLCSDSLGEGAYPRLIILSAGNTGDDLTSLMEYPDYNTLQDIHDPAQAWNALTIGAYTRKTQIEGLGTDDFKALAPAGALSPYSTTSATWDRTMPIKPDVVFEGGNVAVDRLSCIGLPSLKLLTTNSEIATRLFTTFEATSAASALAANFAAKVYSAYPDLRPETVRAIMVHSAEWTDEMKNQFFDHTKTSKKNFQNLVRAVGFGVPNLSKALNSFKNSVSMIIEDELQPFEKKRSKSPSTKDMHWHKLPWPTEELEALGGTEVRLVVTLSYFIEPSPSSRNISSKYRYPSHQLRFDLKRPTEGIDDFKSRISRDAQDVDFEGGNAGGDPNWILGDYRNRGSIHKDIWQGAAADLAERGHLVIYPAMGWWRTRAKLEAYEKAARYTLVLTIESPEVFVDIYTPIVNSIVNKVPAAVVVEIP